MTLAERLASIRARVATAARATHRSPEQVRLIAVSKLQPSALIREAHAAGQRDFAENYAQELRDKAQELSKLDGLRWHFIGHLQANKAKYVAPVAETVQAVDRLELAHELVRRAEGRPPLQVLIEVNIGEEAQKQGTPPSEVEALARALRSVAQLELRGLMCVPPAGQPARPFFAALRELRNSLQRSLAAPLPELSMGMSEDFEGAIAEGATMVRLGTAIFGERVRRG